MCSAQPSLAPGANLSFMQYTLTRYRCYCEDLSIYRASGGRVEQTEPMVFSCCDGRHVADRRNLVTESTNLADPSIPLLRILRAKVMRPQLGGDLVFRPRLLEQLDRGLTRQLIAGWPGD
jgi:hypothetical protein